MIDMGPAPNGLHWAFRANATTVAAVASMLGIVIYLAGFISGYLLLRETVAGFQTSMSAVQNSVGELTTRLTRLEDKFDYAASDLKILKDATKR